MKTYTVTGGTGYIGSKLLAHLSEQEDNLIYAVIRPGSRPKVVKNNIVYVIFDGTESSVELPLHESDYLIHLGALYTTDTKEDSVNDLIVSNITFSTILFNVAQRVNPQIVITSTSTFSSLDGDGNYKPASLYAATKKAVEDIAQAYDLSIHFLTLPDTYGPDDWRPKVHNLVIKNQKWPFEFRSQAKQQIRMLHVDDVIGHLLSSLNQKDKGVHIHDIYSEGILLTLEDLSTLLTDKECTFSSNAEIVKIPTKARSISKETGFINKHKTVSFPWIKK